MTFAIGIRYRTGCAVATDGAACGQPEWPPHPAQVLMALVAAHWDSGGGDDEREALRWLQRQPPPAVLFSEADRRAPVTAYIPINDRPTGSTLLQSAPLARTKQPRSFPRVRPHCDTVYLIWKTTDDCPHLAALQTLCAKVSRIEHRSSLVQVWVADASEFEAAKIVGVNGATAARGAAWRRWQPVDATASTIWSPQLIVRRLVPTDECRHLRLDLAATLQVTAAMHKAVISKAQQVLGLDSVPEWICGHQPDRSPSEQLHLAYFPLALVDSAHATGRLLGLAAAVPADLNGEARRTAHAAIEAVQELCLGRLGRWKLLTDFQGKATLNAELWSGPEHGATRWATVTPIAFDQHPKSKDRQAQYLELSEMVAAGCERIGLPRPIRVRLANVSPLHAVPPAHVFPRLQRKDGSRRRHVHAVLYFDQPVRGPIAVGAGRYRGYGFCRPLREPAH